MHSNAQMLRGDATAVMAASLFPGLPQACMYTVAGILPGELLSAHKALFVIIVHELPF